MRSSAWVVVAGLLSAVGAGCSQPNRANIELRKQNQALATQIEDLNRLHEADQATIRGFEAHVTTQPTLPRERLASLYTVHGLSFGRLTGGADLDAGRPGDEAIKVYIGPMDQQGDVLKSAGSFVIELFDLEQADRPLLGKWEFSTQQAAKNWFGQSLLYQYILTCPWQRVPEHQKLLVRVSFTDELTGRVFVDQRDITIKPPSVGS
ncbi:MAG: hypothetical protein IT447_04640 [Phycisphaerales bacterium]|nr:hypothetical protein [Phycisphaerales bacterium]